MREAKTPTPTVTATAAPTTSSSDGSGAASADQTPAETTTTAASTAESDATEDAGASRASSSYAHAGSSSYASSSSSSYSYDPDTVGNDPGWTKDYPCQFYPPDADGCAEYRSCFDCLNGGVIYRGHGCYVNPSGRCLDLANAKFDKTKVLDFRNATASNNATTIPSSKSSKDVYFPSGAAKYCAASDPICQKCKRTAFENVIENDTKDGYSNFCYGRHNCVCIAVCESPNRQDILGGLVCDGKPQPGHSGSSNQASSQANRSGLDVNANITWLVGVPLVGVIVAVVLVSYNRKNRPRNHTRDVSLFGDGRPFSSVSGLSDSSESMSSSSSSSSSGSMSMSSIDEEAMPHSAENGRQQLNLVGWRALRNELIVREQQLLAGRQDFSSVGYVQLLDTSSSSGGSASVSAATSEDGRESDHEQHEHTDRSSIPMLDAQILGVLPEAEGEQDTSFPSSTVVARRSRNNPHQSSNTAARSFDDDVSIL